MDDKKLFFQSLSFLFILLFISSFAKAAVTPATFPGSADAARVGASVQPMKPAKATASLPTPEVKAPTKIADAENIDFTLEQIVLEDVTVYTGEELRPLFAEYLHKSISLAQLQELVGEITSKYRADGYILSQAILPPQRIKDGIVTIRVFEGHVDRVNIQGANDNVLPLLRAYAESISHERPLTITTLERYALLSNDIPGVNVKVVIAPSEDVQGASTLTFEVTTIQADTRVTVDNRGTRYLGPLQLSMDFDAYNMGFAGGDLNLFLLTSADPFDELTYLRMGYTIPLGDDGLTFEIAGDVTSTDPGFVLTDSDIKGSSFSLMGTFSYPMIRSRDRNWYVNASFQALNNKSTTFGARLFDDRIRSVIFGTTFDFVDSYRGVNVISGKVSQGIDFLGARDTGSPDLSRPLGRSDYTKFNLHASRLQALPRNFSLYGAARGQYALNPLLSAEQFSLGGEHIGRAYDPSEIIGDHGVGALIEIRYDQRRDSKYLKNIQYFVYYDFGTVWNKDNINLNGRSSLSSAGAGLRMNITPSWYGELQIDKPLTRSVESNVLNGDNGKEFRGFFKLKAEL